MPLSTDSRDTPDALDLSALAQSAHQQISAQAQPSAAAARRHKGWRYLAAGLLWVVVLVPVLTDMSGLRTRWIGMPQSAVRAEALATLRAAKVAIDQHRQITGEMPDRVPLAALAALVQFESTPSGYRLSMPMRNGTLSIDQSGAITEQP